jgi:predicted NUDIX family phosphoesterase
MSQSEERVMTIPRFELDNYRIPAVGLALLPGMIDEITERGFVMYPRRSLVESNLNCKHVAVYILVWFEYESVRYYLTYQRGQKGDGEDRLASLWSLGVGGHVNHQDLGVEGAMVREFSEEVPALNAFRLAGAWKLLGVINDESNPVGSVHLGALVAMEIRPPQTNHGWTPVFASSPLRLPTWRDAGDIRRNLAGKFEGWSEIVFRDVIEAGLNIEA